MNPMQSISKHKSSQASLIPSSHHMPHLGMAVKINGCFKSTIELKNSQSVFDLQVAKCDDLKLLKKEFRRYSLDNQSPRSKETFPMKPGSLSSFSLPLLSDLSKRRNSYSGRKSSLSNLLLEHRLETPVRKVCPVNRSSVIKEAKVHEHRRYFICKRKDPLKIRKFDEATKSDEENKEPSFSPRYNLPVRKVERISRKQKLRVSDTQIINGNSMLFQVVKMQLKRTSEMCQNVLPSKRHIKDTDDNFLSNSMVSYEKVKMTDSSREPIPIQKISTSLNASIPEAASKPQPLDCNSDDDCDDYNEQKILNNVNDVSYNMLSSSLSNLKISCEDTGSLQIPQSLPAHYHQTPSSAAVNAQLQSPPIEQQNQAIHNEPCSEPLIILTMAISYYNEREVESLTYVNTLLNRQRVAKITFCDEKAIKDDSTSINHLEVPSKPPSKLKWKGNLVHVLDDDADDSNSPNKKCKEEFNSGTRSLHSPAPLRNFKSIINLKPAKKTFNTTKEEVPTVILQRTRRSVPR